MQHYKNHGLRMCCTPNTNPTSVEGSRRSGRELVWVQASGPRWGRGWGGSSPFCCAATPSMFANTHVASALPCTLTMTSIGLGERVGAVQLKPRSISISETLDQAPGPATRFRLTAHPSVCARIGVVTLGQGHWFRFQDWVWPSHALPAEWTKFPAWGVHALGSPLIRRPP